MSPDCTCDLCRARLLGVSPLELYFEKCPIELKYLKRFPDYPIYYYEAAAIAERVLGEEILSKRDMEAAVLSHAKNCDGLKRMILDNGAYI